MNGYVIFTELIFQWGQVNIPANTVYTENLPISFTSAGFYVNSSHGAGGSVTDVNGYTFGGSCYFIDITSIIIVNTDDYDVPYSYIVLGL